MIVGTIQAFNEEGNIADAVRSLYDAGVDQVLVVDGAWRNPDGTWFGGGSRMSTDGTVDEARRAGARVECVPASFSGGDAAKRELLIRLSGAAPGDHLLLLDADERLVGRVLAATSPSGHGCIVLRNRSNDLPGLRSRWLDRETRQSVPLLRWFRFHRSLHCVAPGQYAVAGRPIRPYLTQWLNDEVGRRPHDKHLLAAYAALRDVEVTLPNEHLSALPILPGLTIVHCEEARADRVEAKLRYYGTRGSGVRDSNASQSPPRVLSVANPIDFGPPPRNRHIFVLSDPVGRTLLGIRWDGVCEWGVQVGDPEEAGRLFAEAVALHLRTQGVIA